MRFPTHVMLRRVLAAALDDDDDGRPCCTLHGLIIKIVKALLCAIVLNEVLYALSSEQVAKVIYSDRA